LIQGDVRPQKLAITYPKAFFKKLRKMVLGLNRLQILSTKEPLQLGVKYG